VDPELEQELRTRLAALVKSRSEDPSAPPLRVEDARKALDLPDARLVPPLLGPDVTVRDGMLLPAGAPDTLAATVREALSTLDRQVTGFVVPTEDELAALGLRAAEIAAAVRAGRLVRLAPDVVLLPGTVAHAVGVLAELPQPFTAGEAREALHTTRKVVVPLLEHLAQKGRTRRDADGRHTVTER
jgi:selenocysteine-specific elongation factor